MQASFERVQCLMGSNEALRERLVQPLYAPILACMYYGADYSYARKLV